MREIKIKAKITGIFILLLCILVTLSVVSAADDTTILGDVNVDGNTTSDIQNAINKANDGDTVNLGENKAYDIESDSIEINKQITLKGDNVSITAHSTTGGISIAGTSNVEVSGITFINPVDLPKYGDTKFTGKAINVRMSSNIIISNCRFINYEYGIEMTTTSDSVVKNSYFNGATTSVSNMEGTGTKAVQLMSSRNINIINNTFDGQIYDALSIASGSSYVNIENNTFINNTFAIFYGGASTQGNKIKNNRFITCGMINETYEYSYNVSGKTYSGNATVFMEDRPYIGLQKASDNIEIVGNEFTVKSNNRIIYSEAENTAHGFPSVIGGILIANNTVKKADPDVVDETVKFYELVVVSSLAISTTSDIDVKDNNFSDIPGISHFEIRFDSITDTNKTVHIPTTSANTMLQITYVKDGRVIVKLTTISGTSIDGESIRYTVNNGEYKYAVTDEYGQIYIDGLSGDVKITATFIATSEYSRSDIEATLYVTPKASPAPAATPTVKVAKKTTTLKIAKKTFKKKATKKLTATLKSAGKAIKGKKITFKVNGKTYSAKTNSKGVATVKIKLTKKGTFKYTAKFAGDATYKAVSKTSKIKVK